MSSRIGLVSTLALAAGFSACAAPSSEDVSQDESALTEPGSVRFVDKPKAIPNEFIVVLRKPLDRSARRDLAASFGARIFYNYEVVLQGFAAQMSDENAKRLSLHPFVEHVERNGIKETSAVQTNATWGLDRIDQGSLPRNGTYSYTLTGAGVNVAVIDTGVDAAHPDFEGRVKPGFNALGTGAPDDTMDQHGHGTHVAGTIASKTWGVAKQATIIPVRACAPQIGCPDAALLGAVEWVTVNVPRPAVVNMSLTGAASPVIDATERAIQTSMAAGITYVVAAGNNAQNACGFTPARVSGVVTVGSTDSSDTRSGFSNWGPCLDIFAPGSSITSARFGSTGAALMSGTSMASPHVAGAAALLLEKDPSATPAQVKASLLANASPNKVWNAWTGSPNRLLRVAP